MRIKYSSNDNVIICQLDLNENSIVETKYVFDGKSRWIYHDTNEDGVFDYLFKDLDNDGEEDEIIKIEN